MEAEKVAPYKCDEECYSDKTKTCGGTKFFSMYQLHSQYNEFLQLFNDHAKFATFLQVMVSTTTIVMVVTALVYKSNGTIRRKITLSVLLIIIYSHSPFYRFFYFIKCIWKIRPLIQADIDILKRTQQLMFVSCFAGIVVALSHYSPGLQKAHY